MLEEAWDLADKSDDSGSGSGCVEGKAKQANNNNKAFASLQLSLLILYTKRYIPSTALLGKQQHRPLLPASNGTHHESP